MEEVVLVDLEGNAVGTMAKAEVHTHTTPLHLAFSCYLFDERGRLLVSRRALNKITWPGVWTNSFCGHLQPEESTVDAVHRRAEQELGALLIDVNLAVPDFRYRAVDASGLVENEICPIYTAVLGSELMPNAQELMQWEWVEMEHIRAAAAAAPFAFSPWMIEQLPLLPQGLPND